LFHRILPLQELIVLFTGVGISAKGNWTIYNDLIEKFGNEFGILLDISRDDLLEKEVDSKLVDLIIRNREKKIRVTPGYDGVYGKAILSEQKTLF
tara:strand:+ start:1093 stop:1377 length:285 start_codon:yes stop_codon:yes gene_type:complete